MPNILKRLTPPDSFASSYAVSGISIPIHIIIRDKEDHHVYPNLVKGIRTGYVLIKEK
jgi:hypothetical protein